MGYRFEFDPVNKILLLRIEGPLTDEVLTKAYAAIRKHSIATDARAGIWDLSGVTEFPISSLRIRELANRENQPCRMRTNGPALLWPQARWDTAWLACFSSRVRRSVP